MISIIIYFSAFIVSIFVAYKYQKLSTKLNKKKIFSHTNSIFWIGLIVIPPILLATKRYGIGTDYFTYETIYNTYSYSNFIIFKKLAIEYGFYLINYVAARIFNDFYGVLLISSFITMIFIFAALNKFKSQLSLPFAFLVFYLLLFPPMLNTIRQLIAVSIIMYAYNYITEREIFKYIFWVIVASLFHYTALICIPFYFLGSRIKSELSIVKRITYYFMLVVTIITLPIILDVVLNIEYLKHYLNVYDLGSDAKIMNQIVLRLPILIPLMIFANKLIKTDRKYEFYYLLFFLELLFIFVGSYYIWGVRLTYYAIPSQIILVPAIVRNIKDKKSKLIACFYFIIWYIVYFIYVFLVKGNDGIFPYQFLT